MLAVAFCCLSVVKADAGTKDCKASDARAFGITWIRHGESTSNIRSHWVKSSARTPVITQAEITEAQWAAGGRRGFAECKSAQVPDADLTELGAAQAKQAALDNPVLMAQLANPSSKYRGRIYCSYLRRAVKTAAILAAEVVKMHPGAKIEIVPIPYIQEAISTHPEHADQTRWDSINGVVNQEWGAVTLARYAIEAVGQRWLPAGVTLNTSFVQPPPIQTSSPTPERGTPEGIRSLHMRAQHFFAFARKHRLLESGEILAVSHGAFVRGTSCFSRELIQSWIVEDGTSHSDSSQVEPVQAGAIPDDVISGTGCALTDAKFSANLAVARLYYEDVDNNGQHVAVGVVDIPEILYTGQATLSRSDKHLHSNKPSWLSMAPLLKSTTANSNLRLR